MPVGVPLVAVLDDEPEMRKALHRLLACRGFRVAEYGQGEDLLAAWDSPAPDCLLLDLHMPGTNGFDVLAAIQARRLTTPVIVITAHDEPGIRERVRALGASAYLKKPVDRDALFSAMATAGLTATAQTSAAHHNRP
jgi:FixJ family two-component response regulator